MNSTAKKLILYAMWDTAHGCGDGAVKANLTCVKLGRLSGGPAKKIQGYNMIQYDTIKECYHSIAYQLIWLDWETWSATSCQDGRFWTTSSWIVFTNGPDALTQAATIHFAQHIIRRHWNLQDLQWEYRTQLDLHSIGAVFQCFSVLSRDFFCDAH